MNILDKIMKPRSIAVVGASTKQHTIGSDIMKRLREYGYAGPVYPVNPKGGVIEGLPAYATVLDIPGEVDLAVIIVNARFVLQTIDQCHEKGIKGLCVISAGFKETGTEGARLEAELLERVRRYGMRCVGPNCLGVVNTHPAVRMDACFAEALPERGNIGFVSQSGALGGGILNILRDLNLGFAQFISIGNQADVNAETALEYWEGDEDVRQILLYMESIQNPANFRRIASRLSKKKPVLALKAGRSAAGASAASSHTGSLAGADLAADALLRQSGVIREFSLKNLFATAKVFANCPIPKGDRVAIVTNSGGPGIMGTDAICEKGMKMAELTDETKAKLRSFLPAAASVRNPVDMIASAPIEHYRQTLETVLADPNVDMVITIYLPFLGLKDTDVARAIMEIKAAHPEKPVVGVFMTKSEFFTAFSAADVNVPFFMYVEEAVEGLARLNEQRLWIERPEGVLPDFKVDGERARNIIRTALADGRDQLTTRESIDVLDAYGVRVCRAGFAADEDAAVAVADRIGLPRRHEDDLQDHVPQDGRGRRARQHRLSRGASRRIPRHLSPSSTSAACSTGLKASSFRKWSRAPAKWSVASPPILKCGPMIMFGLGGVFVEVLKDVAFRIAPVTDTDARDMVRSVKAYKLLQGARGTTPADIAKVEETLLRLSQLVTDLPFIDELDINPLMISEKTGEPIAVDGRIKVRRCEAESALA